MREELKGKNFEVFTVAFDSKGAAAAESWIKQANPQHPSVIDEQHRVAELYGAKNVPSVFWIDEQGSIVRANDPVYVVRRNRETGESTVNQDYLNAVRDWVAKGPTSIYVQEERRVLAHTSQTTAEDVQALAFFRLGVCLFQQGHAKDAVSHFKRAHQLKPNNWTYRRQAYNLGNIEQDYGTTFQQAREDPANQPFYPPLELPKAT